MGRVFFNFSRWLHSLYFCLFTGEQIRGARKILKEFVKRVETHYNLKVSKIKSNGRDILIKIFKYGIKIEE